MTSKVQRMKCWKFIHTWEFVIHPGMKRLIHFMQLEGGKHCSNCSVSWETWVSVSNVSKKVHWMLILHFSFPCTFISNNNIFICFDKTSERHRTVAVTIIHFALHGHSYGLALPCRVGAACVCVPIPDKPALAKICCRPRLPHRPAFSLLLSCCVCSSTVRLVSQNCFLFPFCCAWIPALDALPTLCLWSLVSRASLVLICLPERLPCLVLGADAGLWVSLSASYSQFLYLTW